MREDGVKPMSTLDRQEAIPLEVHGTKEGYDLGCRGSHCVGRDRLGQSCEAAKIRYARDMSYRRRVDAGMSAEAIAAEDALDEDHQVTKIVPQKEVHPASTTSFSDSEEPLDDPVDDEVVEQLGDPGDEPDDQVDDVVADVEPEVPSSSLGIPETDDGIAYEKHGTTAGYSAGCRRKNECPGVTRVGKSCTQAVADYQRDLNDRKKAAAAALAGEPQEAVLERAQEVRVESALGELADAAGEVETLRSKLDKAEADLAIAETGLAAALGEREELTRTVARLTAEGTDKDERIRDLGLKVATAQEQLIQKGLELDVAKSADVTVLLPRPVAVPAPEPRLSGAGLDIRTEDGGVSVRLQGGEPLHLELNFTDGALSGAAVHIGA